MLLENKRAQSLDDVSSSLSWGKGWRDKRFVYLSKRHGFKIMVQPCGIAFQGACCVCQNCISASYCCMTNNPKISVAYDSNHLYFTYESVDYLGSGCSRLQLVGLGSRPDTWSG